MGGLRLGVVLGVVFFLVAAVILGAIDVPALATPWATRVRCVDGRPAINALARPSL